MLPQDVTVVSLSNITVQCEAQGYPLPMLTWQHDGQQVVTNEPKQSVFSNQPDDIQVMSTLLVRMSDFKDRGLYKCVVKNLVGEDQAKATVVVQCECTAPCCMFCLFFTCVSCFRSSCYYRQTNFYEC